MTDDRRVRAKFDGGPWDELEAFVSVDKFKAGKIVLDDTGHYPPDGYEGPLYVFSSKAKDGKAVLELLEVQNEPE